MQFQETSRIVVGDDRIRRVLPRVPELAESIRERGQLQPIVVRASDWRLLAGARRLAACKLLGTKVLVRLVATADEALEALRCEGAEQLERVDWTPEERARYAQRLEGLEAAAAAERRAAGAAEGGRRKALAASGTADPQAEEPEADDARESGRAKTRAALAAGFPSRKAYERTLEVVEAAERDPERFGGLLEELNRTGKAAAVAAKLERLEEGSDPDSWCTPSWVLELVHAVEQHGITLDPCSNANAIALDYVKASTAWTIDDDALAQPTWDLEPGWTVVWYQPPYSDPSKLTARCVDEFDKGVRRVWALVKLDTSTGWWSQLRDRAPILILPRRRLAHVVGDKPRKGSDFCSGMLLLTRERGAELLDLHRRVQAACGDKADAYLAPWALAELAYMAPEQEGAAEKRPRAPKRKAAKRGARPRKAG